MNNWRKEIMEVLIDYDKRYSVASLTILMDKIEPIIQSILDQKARQIKAFKIVKPQKDNGLTYPVGAIHKAYNDGLEDALKILKGEE
jgi:hypothetical protein